jgi:hypothetical protein
MKHENIHVFWPSNLSSGIFVLKKKFNRSKVQMNKNVCFSDI